MFCCSKTQWVLSGICPGHSGIHVFHYSQSLPQQPAILNHSLDICQRAGRQKHNCILPKKKYIIGIGIKTFILGSWFVEWIICICIYEKTSARPTFLIEDVVDPNIDKIQTKPKKPSILKLKIIITLQNNKLFKCKVCWRKTVSVFIESNFKRQLKKNIPYFLCSLKHKSWLNKV